MKEKAKKTNTVPMKKRIIDTAKKTGIGVLGVGGGTLAGAGLGFLAPFAGLALLGAGYFLGGKWQVLTVVGAATLGYGIAKSQENRLDTGVKERLVTFKNDWLHAFYLDKLVKKSDSGYDDESGDPSIGAIDLSELDHFDEKLKESAIKFQMSQMSGDPESNVSKVDFEPMESSEYNYSIIEEDEVDFDNF